MKLIYFFCLSLCWMQTHAQIIDFENLPISPGTSVSSYAFSGGDCTIRFFSGFNLNDTLPLTLQRVAYNSGNGGFYGVNSSKNCNGASIPTTRVNQINDKNYTLNEEFTNRERVGCYFLSGILEGSSLPSIFVLYEGGTTACSGDLLDVDGHDNSIEAYDIYYYSSTRNYPDYPINTRPIKIKAIGEQFGYTSLGDNGGVYPFKIEADRPFELIEIRPIPLVDSRNARREVFGFALDNFSPCSLEKAPYTPPYLAKSKEDFTIDFPTKPEAIPEPEQPLPTIEPLTVYFDFDTAVLTPKGHQAIRQWVTTLKDIDTKQLSITLNGFTDLAGSEAYNLKLAERRLKTVVNALVQLGLSKAQITTTSFGENYNGPKNATPAQRRCVQLNVNLR